MNPDTSNLDKRQRRCRATSPRARQSEHREHLKKQHKSTRQRAREKLTGSCLAPVTMRPIPTRRERKYANWHTHQSMNSSSPSSTARPPNARLGGRHAGPRRVAQARATLNRAEALRLRVAGYSEREIAARLGVKVSDYLAGVRACEIVLKISARLAALYGLDAPRRSEVSGTAGQPLGPALSPALETALIKGYGEIASTGSDGKVIAFPPTSAKRPA